MLRDLQGGLLGRLVDQCPLIEVSARLDLGRERWELLGLQGEAMVICITWPELGWGLPDV
jgi:hypothetical protein